MLWLLLLMLSSCAGKSSLPKMDIPPPVDPPAIKAEVIVKDGVPYVAYKHRDALKLYEFLERMDQRMRELERRLQ